MIRYQYIFRIPIFRGLSRILWDVSGYGKGRFLLQSSRKRPIVGGDLRYKNGGEGGIRTRERRKPLRDFQSRPFVHSGTSPHGPPMGRPSAATVIIACYRCASVSSHSVALRGSLPPPHRQRNKSLTSNTDTLQLRGERTERSISRSFPLISANSSRALGGWWG